MIAECSASISEIKKSPFHDQLFTYIQPIAGILNGKKNITAVNPKENIHNELILK